MEVRAFQRSPSIIQGWFWFRKWRGNNKSCRRFSRVQMKRSTIKLLRLSFDSILLTFAVVLYLAVSRSPLGSCRFILTSYNCAGHPDPIGTLLEESAWGLYPILLAGAQLGPNISLQREMVQECVKRQGAQDREMEGGKRGRWGGLEPCETGMM